MALEARALFLLHSHSYVLMDTSLLERIKIINLYYHYLRRLLPPLLGVSFERKGMVLYSLL